MGDRGNIIVKVRGEADLYLYTHWRGYDLANILKSALKHKDRWSDASYLARIIFCEMVKGKEAEETGFGISTFPPDTGAQLIVDVDAMTVDGVSFEKFVAA